MAAKKKKKKTKSRRRKTPLSKRNFKLKLKKGTTQSIAALSSLLVAFVLFLSFTEQTSFLSTINGYLVTPFGWTAFMVPIVLFLIGLILANYSLAITQPHVLVGLILLLISLSGLTRAGSIGLEIWDSLSLMITETATILLLILSSVVGFMVIFSLSIEQVVIWIMKMLLPVRTGLTFLLNKMNVENPEEEKSGVGERTLKIRGSSLENQEKNESDLDIAKIEKNVQTTPVAASETSDDSGLYTLTQNSGPVDQIWELPPHTLLDAKHSGSADRGDVKANADKIEKTLESFNIRANVVEVNMGPAVTQYALEVPLGTKVSKITNLASDLALSLAARTGQIRVEAPIPGRSLIGIELPNYSPEFVGLKTMLGSESMKKLKSKLGVALGLDVAGNPVAINLGKMPHLLIAGSTGSGKSVCVNSFITSVLFRATPSEVRFIMVDPKRVELTRYNGIPHLLSPVIVEPKKVLSALKWSTEEMDRRYKIFAEVGARNLEAYNEISGFQALPYIVIIIDELADVMMFAPSEVEDAICRLAQMARATGIHLVIATQRPSVDVLTGLIKANIPARIAFAVSSMTDSRVVLDTSGAEKLLGQGDMLFLAPDQAKPVRLQGAYISDEEVLRLLEFIKGQGIGVDYAEEVTSMPTGKISSGTGKEFSSPADDRDEYFDNAVHIISKSDSASASLLQRKLSVGYARAARILDQLEAAGLVGPSEGSKPREINITALSDFVTKQNS